MSDARFTIGSLYFIGGYRDSARTQPREIRPVVYLGTGDAASRSELLVMRFEDLGAWTDRRGLGEPDPQYVHEIEGPPDTKLAMSLGELIEELHDLKLRLG